MFTGIIETIGTVKNIVAEGTNLHFTIQSPISNELKIDQSVSHNGVCLTVVAMDAANTTHTVTAIHETLIKTNLGNWQVGSIVNIERCMPANGRFDGHIVQGHVDQTATCTNVEEADGSWYYTFEYEPKGNITVEKGSITINGVSLTVVNSTNKGFSVAIIPYTYEHTNFQTLQVGQTVNLEFDIVGKYIARLLEQRN
ncbi:riboflavin synthase [Oscillatoria amoena NRMC-F 0135]|nr:riboflavin synthase [Oscillatoria amoena NRMC-F 0135]